ncbi:GMC family oxidoreductase [Pseudooceanicola algae]|uniref:Pyridoxine 4-oxidase n=1 Tax=Pseudooceanicola algae TaxID=1537215 RepID=A0A418SIM2_9RHOB|nr:GMC oxidoreductase [Pseudooceanicola algae]QPM91169.1 Pyridoxine 4-oxidase [Pseudooceanicola algae]
MTDILILGAGSAGCILAARLSQDPTCEVTLVEAGGWPNDPDIARPAMWPFIQGRDFDWGFVTEPQPGTAGRRHHWARGRALGGSSNLHAMAHVRGHPEDFDTWARLTGSQRWSYDSLLPYFRMSESCSTGADDLHGGDGPMPVLLPQGESHPIVGDYIRSWTALGLPRLADHNGREMIGATPNALMIRDGRRVTVADAYLTSEVLARPNLTVLDDTLVHRLTVQGARVTGAEVTRHGQPGTVTGGCVLLAMGAIASPLLLMRSGYGDPAVLSAAGIACRDARSEIGRNLHDHLLGAGNLYRSARPLAPSRLQLSESMTYQSADPSRTTGKPDIVVGCVVGPSAAEGFDAPPPGEAFTLLFGVTHPTSRGALHVTGPRIDDKPVIDPRYLQTDHDRRMFRIALDRARAVARSAPLSEWVQEEVLPGPVVADDAALDDFIARSAITHHHPVGTCRMGADEASVTDADLRMRGLDNLWIVDSSVIPAITAGPVHAAVMALAESFAAGMRAEG